jgi:SAM-dependent methyltransferase
LEVGSGLGYLTFALQKAGYNVQGIDISIEAVTNAQAKFGNFYICDDLLTYANEKPNQYDVIIMTEVIEHLNNPQAFIGATYKLLRAHGACIITTPNKSFYPHNATWLTDAPPIHCWWFSENSLEHIAHRYKMQLQFVDFKEYYKKHPEIFIINNFNNLGEHVFTQDGKVISLSNNKSNKKKIPAWLKKIKCYILIRNLILCILNPNKYKIGSSQSINLCAILTK